MVPFWGLVGSSTRLDGHGNDNPLANCVVTDENILFVLALDLGL